MKAHIVQEQGENVLCLVKLFAEQLKQTLDKMATDRPAAVLEDPSQVEHQFYGAVVRLVFEKAVDIPSVLHIALECTGTAYLE